MAYIERVHFQVMIRNGITVVLCNKDPEMVSKVTEKTKSVTCRHCLSRLAKLKVDV